MALREVTVIFDDANDPELKRALDRIESPENHDRWRHYKSVVLNRESSGVDEVKDFKARTLRP